MWLYLLLWVLLLEVSSEVSSEVSCSQLSLPVWSSTELKGTSLPKLSEPKQYANSHSKTSMQCFTRHGLRQAYKCMPDKPHDGRNIALKFLSGSWRAQSSKQNFYIRTSTCLISFMTAQTVIFIHMYNLGYTSSTIIAFADINVNQITVCGPMHQLTFVCLNVCVYVCVIHMWHDILQAFPHICIAVPCQLNSVSVQTAIVFMLYIISDTPAV